LTEEREDEWVKKGIQRLIELSGTGTSTPKAEARVTVLREVRREQGLGSSTRLPQAVEEKRTTVYRCDEPNCGYSTLDIEHYVKHVVKHSVSDMAKRSARPPLTREEEKREKACIHVASVCNASKIPHFHLPSEEPRHVGEHQVDIPHHFHIPSGVSEEKKPNLCPKCKTELKKDDIFDYLYCPNCGTVVD